VKDVETGPLTPADAAAVARVWRACEEHADGRALFTEDDFLATCARPSTKLERDTVGVRDGDELVGVGMLHGDEDAFVGVLPSHRGRGIGAALLRWSQDAARAAGHARTCQTLSVNDRSAIALLEADGYERGWEGWIFDVELDREPDPRALAPGYALREFVAGRDDRAVHRLVEDAFGEWRDADEGTFEDWAAATLGRPGFVPEHIGTVVRGEEVVAVAVLIREKDALWVAQLAVERSHRGRGLARALLVHAFAVAWRSGLRRCGLATDARTGARGLYEHVGMRVTRTTWEYAKLL